MIIPTEQDMLAFGRRLVADLALPATIELIGDVGAGKTTLARGLALGLGITDPLTSPSFTIQKSYTSAPGTASQEEPATLNHFDFYRLPEPGIMAEDLAESISSPRTLTVIEWAETVADILPSERITVTITYNPDLTRTVEVATPPSPIHPDSNPARQTSTPSPKRRPS